VLALGKLGGREMLPASDLDLVMLYDHPPEAEASQGGRRSLAPSEYYVRLAHQLVAALISHGAERRLWDIDMRLRPSGSKGPVAVNLSGFEKYHLEDAWTWERMALTRARPVAGPPALKRRVQAMLRAVLTRPPVAAVLADATAMRRRLLRELPAEGPWDVKAMPGGLMEVEFIAQALQLHHGAARPEVLAVTTRVALARLAKAGALSAAEAALLTRADRLWRTILGMLRLTVGRAPEEMLTGPAAAALLRAVAPCCDPAPVDLAALRAQMAEVAAAVRAIFERRIGSLTGDAG